VSCSRSAGGAAYSITNGTVVSLTQVANGDLINLAADSPPWHLLVFLRLAAGRAVRRACGAPRGRDGAVEAIRTLMVAKRSARAERTQTINQVQAVILTGLEDLRAQLTSIAGRAWSPRSHCYGPGPATQRPRPPGLCCANSGGAEQAYADPRGRYLACR